MLEIYFYQKSCFNFKKRRRYRNFGNIILQISLGKSDGLTVFSAT